MKYARIVDSIVVETFTPPEGFTIEECFTAELVAQFRPCPEELKSGWTLEKDGTFTPPPPAPEPEPTDQPEEPITE